jgi:hypothetical protein
MLPHHLMARHGFEIIRQFKSEAEPVTPAKTS